MTKSSGINQCTSRVERACPNPAYVGAETHQQLFCFQLSLFQRRRLKKGVGNGFQNGRISLLDFRFADDDSTSAHANYVAQCFKEPLVETCPGVSGKMKEKNWKTNKHMGFADTNVLPMEMLGRMGGNSIDYIWHSIWTVPMQGLNKTKVGREHTLAFLPSPSHKERLCPKARIAHATQHVVFRESTKCHTHGTRNVTKEL